MLSNSCFYIPFHSQPCSPSPFVHINIDLDSTTCPAHFSSSSTFLSVRPSYSTKELATATKKKRWPWKTLYLFIVFFFFLAAVPTVTTKSDTSAMSSSTRLVKYSGSRPPSIRFVPDHLSSNIDTSALGQDDDQVYPPVNKCPETWQGFLIIFFSSVSFLPQSSCTIDVTYFPFDQQTCLVMSLFVPFLSFFI